MSAAAKKPSWAARMFRRLCQVVRFTAGVAVGAGAAWLIPQGVSLVRHHSYFEVRQIDVRGVEVLERDAVLAAAGLHVGMSIWDATPEAAGEGIRALARVRRASVSRLFPDRLVISIAEREPAAIAVIEGLQYLDRSGRVLGPVRAGDSLDLPFITGVDGSHLAGAGVRTLRRALRFARLCRRRGTGGGVSELHLDPERGLVLVPRSVPVPVVVGWGSWRDKLQRLDRVLAAWKGREERLAVVDVTLRQAAVVKVKAKPRRGKRGDREGSLEI